MARTIPKSSSSVDDVMRQMRAMQSHDGDYRASRTWGLIYNAGPEVDRMLHECVDLTLKENALNPLVFPSLKEMQRDVVAIAADLFHGGEEAGGAMTSGGTESIFMAVKAARDKARAERGIAKGKLVIPRTAHPAFVKAAHLLDIEYVHVPTREDLRTEMQRAREQNREAIAALLTEEQRTKFEDARATRQLRQTRRGQVWVIGTDGKPAAINVVTGMTDGTVTEILRGELKEGQPVIIGSAAAPGGSAGGSSRGPRFGF